MHSLEVVPSTRRTFLSFFICLPVLIGFAAMLHYLPLEPGFGQKAAFCIVYGTPILMLILCFLEYRWARGDGLHFLIVSGVDGTVSLPRHQISFRLTDKSYTFVYAIFTRKFGGGYGPSCEFNLYQETANGEPKSWPILRFLGRCPDFDKLGAALEDYGLNYVKQQTTLPSR